MKKYTIFLLFLSVLLSPTRRHRSPEGRSYLINIFSKCLLKCLVFVFSLYVFFLLLLFCLFVFKQGIGKSLQLATITLWINLIGYNTVTVQSCLVLLNKCL